MNQTYVLLLNWIILIKKEEFRLLSIDYNNTEMNTFTPQENSRNFWTLYLLSYNPKVKTTLNSIFRFQHTLFKEKGYLPGDSTEWDDLYIIRLNKNSYYCGAIVYDSLPQFLVPYRDLLYKMSDLNKLDIKKGIRLLGKKSRGKKAGGKKSKGKSRGKK